MFTALPNHVCFSHFIYLLISFFFYLFQAGELRSTTEWPKTLPLHQHFGRYHLHITTVKLLILVLGNVCLHISRSRPILTSLLHGILEHSNIRPRSFLFLYLPLLWRGSSRLKLGGGDTFYSATKWVYLHITTILLI